jgi:hypothetical protein
MKVVPAAHVLMPGTFSASGAMLKKMGGGEPSRPLGDRHRGDGSGHSRGAGSHYIAALIVSDGGRKLHRVFTRGPRVNTLESTDFVIGLMTERQSPLPGKWSQSMPSPVAVETHPSHRIYSRTLSMGYGVTDFRPSSGGAPQPYRFSCNFRRASSALLDALIRSSM